MRLLIMLACGLCGAALLGCQPGAQGGAARVDDQRQPFNRWAMKTLDDDSIANAVIAQHTLYPYHFVDGTAELNSLGERDVRILAGHMLRHPGEISVHKGGEPKDMYESRVGAVTKMLTRFEVPPASIKIVDKLPGGEGTSSERAVLILQRSYESKPLSGDSGSENNIGGQDSGSSSGSSSNSGGTKQ